MATMASASARLMARGLLKAGHPAEVPRSIAEHPLNFLIDGVWFVVLHWHPSLSAYLYAAPTQEYE